MKEDARSEFIPATDFLVRRGAEAQLRPSRRPGLREAMLLAASDSRFQNVVLVEADQGAEVELHPVRTSESLFILEGTFRISSRGGVETVGPGDLCHFRQDSEHGMSCQAGPGRYLVVFAPGADSVPSDEWLRTLYSEAWRQYVHEDDLGVKRTTLFVGAQALLITLLTTLVTVVLRSEAGPFANPIVAVRFLASAALIVGLPGIVILRTWSAVTHAGRAYLNLRWASARAIEIAAGLGTVALGGLEDRWRDDGGTGKSVKLFPDQPLLKDIPRRNKVGQWRAIQQVITALTAMWLLIMGLAIWCLVRPPFILNSAPPNKTAPASVAPIPDAARPAGR